MSDDVKPTRDTGANVQDNTAGVVGKSAVTVSPIFLQLLVFLFGNAWALLTPKPDRFKWHWVQHLLRFLNFGQSFGIKEHVVASLVASSSNNGLAGVEAFAIERLFYNTTVSATTAVLGTFSISLCGFVLAGLLRSVIVYPAEMVYWTKLPQISLFQNLHFDRSKNKDRLSKFSYALSLSAVWELFPAYIMPWLGGISIFCLASINAPTHLRTVFGTIFGGVSSNEGLGLLEIGLDWQYITSLFLSYPLKNQLNLWIGMATYYPSMLGLYYGNAWNARNFPFMSSTLFASNGTKYNTLAVLNDKGLVDKSKLAEVGLPHLTASTVWGYLTQNLAIGALIGHVIIFWSKETWQAFKRGRNRTQTDIHYQGMLKYKEVPYWWYLCIFLLCFFAGLIVVLKGEIKLKGHSAILYGLYGNGIMTNQLSQMVAGAVQPGSPLANVYFASWSHEVILLGINLAGWLKIGQYTKIPPRVMFFTQTYGTLLGTYLNYAVMTTVVTAQREVLLDPLGNNVWSGSYLPSMNSEAITWAMAKQMYSIGGRYPLVPIAIAIGFGLPVLQWILLRIFPLARSWPIMTAVIASNMAVRAFGNTSWLFSSVLIGIFSQVWLRKRHPGVFNKYIYLIGAAMDGGSQIVIFVLSFAVFGASGASRPFPTWWGNPTGNADHCL